MPGRDVAPPVNLPNSPDRFHVLAPRTVQAFDTAYHAGTDVASRLALFSAHLHRTLGTAYRSESARMAAGDFRNLMFFHDDAGDRITTLSASLPTSIAGGDTPILRWRTPTAIAEFVSLVAADPMEVRGLRKVSAAHLALLAFAHASTDPARRAAKLVRQPSQGDDGPDEAHEPGSAVGPQHNLMLVDERSAVPVDDKPTLLGIVEFAFRFPFEQDLTDWSIAGNRNLRTALHNYWHSRAQRYDRLRGLGLPPRVYYGRLRNPSVRQLGYARRLKLVVLNMATHAARLDPEGDMALWDPRMPLPYALWEQAWPLVTRKDRPQDTPLAGIPGYASLDAWAETDWGSLVIESTYMPRQVR